MARDINQEYFSWLCYLIDENKCRQYSRLITYLHTTEFVYIMPMDGNRYDDGINLRYRFGNDNNIEDPVIASCLDDKSCSILEMMVSLSVRVEEHIMQNPDNGLQPGRWFWMMIDNLGLSDQTDRNYDSEYANSIIWRFLNRQYDSDGRGGLIYLPSSRCDLRDVEIWYQMMWYLSEYNNVNEGE